jgi:hypothetical protein
MLVCASLLPVYCIVSSARILENSQRTWNPEFEISCCTVVLVFHIVVELDPASGVNVTMVAWGQCLASNDRPNSPSRQRSYRQQPAYP